MEPRLRAIGRVFALLLAVVVVRLLMLQVVQGARYARLSDSNRIRRIVKPAPRGRILDRKGKTIADTRPSFTCTAVPTELDSVTVQRLAALLDIPLADLQARLGPVAAYPSPVTVKRNLSFEEVARLAENEFRLNGVQVRTDPLRSYLLGRSCAHAVGYVAEATEDELKADTALRRLDYVGRTGLEAEYEKLLRGRAGVEYAEVDARGQEIGPLREKRPEPATPGKDLYLTLDADLQELAWRLTAGFDRAAVVGMEVKTGAVVCLVSRPAFDPALFLGRIDPADWTALSGNPSKPFFNRAITSSYPPGSTMKPVVALAGLRRGVARADTRLQPCTGSLRYGNRTFKCWGVHGSVDLVEALAVSCNVYFYQLGQRVGLDSLCGYAGAIGMGQETAIDIPGEGDGNVPNRAWLDQRYGKSRWGAGSLLNFAIGQGEVLATPLQMAAVYAAIANDGIACQPHLLARADSAGRTVWSATLESRALPMRPADIAVVRQGLDRVVEYGTGTAARMREVTISGKTGTAQNPPRPDHAWFVGYAPSDDPQVVFAVLVENAGHGGTVSAPIARQLVRQYFFPGQPELSDSARAALPDTITRESGE
jgi:penicillin-binding protein 2